MDGHNFKYTHPKTKHLVAPCRSLTAATPPSTTCATRPTRVHGTRWRASSWVRLSSTCTCCSATTWSCSVWTGTSSTRRPTPSPSGPPLQSDPATDPSEGGGGALSAARGLDMLTAALEQQTCGCRPAVIHYVLNVPNVPSFPFALFFPLSYFSPRKTWCFCCSYSNIITVGGRLLRLWRVSQC